MCILADYAKQLFSNDRAWGLIAVPLGKKSNVKNSTGRFWRFSFEELNSLDGIGGCSGTFQ